MALNFANVTDVRIPQGDCIRIQETVGGRILWEKKKGKYEIRKNGVTVDWVDIDQLQRKITDGTAQSQYGIGAQLVLSYRFIHPSTGEELNLECPMNFGTFRTFTREDGSTFKGLGMQSLYALPDIFGFNYYVSCQDKDGGRWKRATIRHCINGHGTNWAQEAAAPAREYRLNIVGLLDRFPVDFIEALAPVRIATTVYGGSIDITYDTFFLLSLEEAYCSWDNTVNITQGTEGAAWEYWIQKIGNSPQSIGNSNPNRIIQDMKDKGNVPYVAFRTSYLVNPYVNNEGLFYSGNSGGIYGTVGYDVDFAIVPACVLPAL